MTVKKEQQPKQPTMRELQDLCEHVCNVLVDNAKTNTLVYGLLQSLIDDSKRGITRKTLKKEMQDAINVAQEQFLHLFFTNADPNVDKSSEGGDE